MPALTCDVCGGTLSIDAGGKTATCQFCGTQHSMERVREKVQEIKGAVKIEGEVVVRGIPSQENLRIRARESFTAGQWAKAQEYYEKILDISPEDSEARCRISIITRERIIYENIQNGNTIRAGTICTCKVIKDGIFGVLEVESVLFVDILSSKACIQGIIEETPRYVLKQGDIISVKLLEDYHRTYEKKAYLSVNSVFVDELEVNYQGDIEWLTYLKRPVNTSGIETRRMRLQDINWERYLDELAKDVLIKTAYNGTKGSSSAWVIDRRTEDMLPIKFYKNKGTYCAFSFEDMTYIKKRIEGEFSRIGKKGKVDCIPKYYQVRKGFFHTHYKNGDINYYNIKVTVF